MVASRIHRTERAWADAREPALQLIWNTTTDLEVESGGLVDHRAEVAAEVRILRCTRLGRYFQIVVQFCDCHFQVSLCCWLNRVLTSFSFCANASLLFRCVKRMLSFHFVGMRDGCSCSQFCRDALGHHDCRNVCRD